MQIKNNIFRSKIAIRIFATFIICAMLPVGCFALVSYIQVTHYLQSQTIQSLRQAVKSHTKILFDRLEFIETELALVDSVYHLRKLSESVNLDESVRSRLLKRFDSITNFKHPNKPQHVINQLEVKSLDLTPNNFNYLKEGKPLLLEIANDRSDTSIIMIRLLDAEDAKKGYVAGKINLKFLWAIDEMDDRPLDTEICILDSSNNLLYSSQPNMSNWFEPLKLKTQSSTAGYFEFNASGKEYFASFSQMFLKPTYKLPHWTVILFKAKSDVFEPVATFRLIFPLIITLTFMIVLWLSMANIRKSLIPITALKKGARRIAKNDFSECVRVSSNDEFGELALAFNHMAEALDHKFRTLSAKADIDRAVLSKLNCEDIIKSAIKGITDCIPCLAHGISMLGADSSSPSTAIYGYESQGQMIFKTPVKISPEDLESLQQHNHRIISQTNDQIPRYIPISLLKKSHKFLILPIRVKEKISAILWIGINKTKIFTSEDKILAKQLADQIAVALSNSNLIEELKEINWGTLQALARTVDAKSSWTAGHSQRVTELAIKIGSVLNIKPEALENLHRAALLHDIGKVGIPSKILNKKSNLTREEYKLIKSHPLSGAKIIEPITSFKDIKPIIAQHHERYDGKGYPEGLIGETIHLGARILAVADVYDALGSDRPYRNGLTIDALVDFMKNESGKSFDPNVVKALLKILADDKKKAA